jgi:hypothetical protein
MGFRRRRCVLARLFPIALLIAWPTDAASKPKPGSKDDAALHLEQKAVQTYVGGDPAAAARSLEHGLRTCEPPGPCAPKTRAHLHVTLGTVKGAGEGDYTGAKKEFAKALALDPEIRLSPALANPQLTAVFEEARTEAAAKPPEKPPEKPINMSDILHPEDPPPPPPATKQATPAPPSEIGPQPLLQWLSARVMIDFAFIADKNVCAPGAPSNYFCTDENGARYTGRPQPETDPSSGFALSTVRVLIGYERVVAGGFTAGAFAGLAVGFGGAPNGRSGMFPLHLEARGTYTFGEDPYVPAGMTPQRFHPFVFGSLGYAELDTTIAVRVDEIPCEIRAAPACRRDLEAHRRVGRLFAAIGGGARWKIEGRHALRLAARATMIFDLTTFVVSPELAYELGF